MTCWASAHLIHLFSAISFVLLVFFINKFYSNLLYIYNILTLHLIYSQFILDGILWLFFLFWLDVFFIISVFHISIFVIFSFISSFIDWFLIKFSQEAHLHYRYCWVWHPASLFFNLSLGVDGSPLILFRADTPIQLSLWLGGCPSIFIYLGLIQGFI